jgi:hypothetical protein
MKNKYIVVAQPKKVIKDSFATERIAKYQVEALREAGFKKVRLYKL